MLRLVPLSNKTIIMKNVYKTTLYYDVKLGYINLLFKESIDISSYNYNIYTMRSIEKK